MYEELGLPEARASLELKAKQTRKGSTFENWLEERTVMDPGADTGSRVSREDYTRWARTHAAPLLSPQAFAEKLRQQGLHHIKDGAGCMAWRGLRLRKDASYPPEEEVVCEALSAETVIAADVGVVPPVVASEIVQLTGGGVCV